MRKVEKDPSDWQAALAAWQEEEERQRKREALRGASTSAGKVPVGWWIGAFANPPSPSEERGHPCGERQMLTIVAYDITDPRRLQKVAKFCEDHGLRVQFSVFECRMEAEEFELFWMELVELINPEEDRVVAYRICAECAQRIYSAGIMESNQTHVAYFF